MSWDFEVVAADNDWWVFDLDSFVTKSWAVPVGWTLYSETATNKVLASQSWFTNAAATDPANDWAFSEAFDIPNDGGAYEAAWDARASQASPFNDGYEFRIIEDASFTTLNNGFTATTKLAEMSTAFVSGTTVLLTVPGENLTWTTRRVSLNAYKGKKVRLVWRNNTVDRNMLFLDNAIAYKKDDYATTSKIMSTPVIPYTYVPQFLAKNYVGTVTTKVDNNGSLALTGVTASFSGYKNDVLDFSDVVAVGALAVAGTSNAVSKSYTITAAKPANSYYFTTTVDATENAMSYAESLTVTGPEISDSIYARDNGTQKGYTSISSSSASATKKIGNIFELIAPTKLHSVTFAIYNCTAPSTIVRVFSTTDYVTLTEVAASSAITLTPAVVSLTPYTVTFTGLTLPAGKYVVTLDEPASKSIGLVTTSNSAGVGALYTTATVWNATSSTLYIRLKVSQPITGINDQYTKNLNVYYTTGGIVVNGLKAETSATVYTLAGQALSTTKLINENNTINAKLSTGVYVLKVGATAYKVIVE
jgi:hypothetical protein